MDDRHVVWSNENLNLEDWRADLEEEYPGYSDDELYEIMCETNADYLGDERLNLNIQLGTDIFGNIQRLDNTFGAFEERMAACVEQLENTHVQLENAKVEVQKPFPQEEELKTKTERLNELNALLNLDKKENEIVDGERGEEEPQRSSDERER